MSRRGGGKGGGGQEEGETAAIVAVAATSKRHDNREQVDSRESECESENATHLSLPCALLDLGSKRNKRSIRKNEAWVGGDSCQTTTTTTTTTSTTTTTRSSRKSDDIVESSVAEKFSVDLEKWLKTCTEPTRMELDTIKVVEGVDRYLSVEELSSHVFLEKDPYEGLSIDIDLANNKKDGLNLTAYDPILQDELPSEKLLEPCEKVDDEYMLPEFQLYHLDPLPLSPDDMMVAGEILPSTSGQPTLSENHVQEINKSHAAATTVSRAEQRSGGETSREKSARFAVNELRTNIGNAKEADIESEKKEEKEEKEEAEEKSDILRQRTIEAQTTGNPSELFMEVLSSLEHSSAVKASDSANKASNAVMEQLRTKTRAKLAPRIIKKRRQASELLEKNFDKHVNNGNKNFATNGDSQDVMAVVAISTDKVSNTTQIVINTGTERQIYQGKTSELIEATGNFPMLPKIDTSAAATTVWINGVNVECNGIDSGNSGSSQYELVISNALEELGITDDSLQSVCVTENDKVWLCPRDDCNRQFGRLYTLKGHLLSHYGIRPFKCDFEGCTWAFYSEFKLKRHKETHLKRKDYVCEVEGCNRRFTTIYNLWSHAKLHSRPNRIICQVPNCDEKFQTKRALELHMKSHDQRHAPYMCQHEGCGKRYYSSNALTSHQRSHSYKEVDVKCSWPGCGKVFDKPCRLKAHTRSHTGCKPYHCTYQDCKWAFSSSSKLKRHQKKHTNERKFACDVPGCGKAFMRSEHLKEHRLTHTEGRYFRCFVCDARFSAKSSLYVHIKKHQAKTMELTNMADDTLERVSSVGAVSQKRVRTEESHCSTIKHPVYIKSSSQRSAKLLTHVDAERFRSEKESDTVSRDDVEQQPVRVRAESSRIHNSMHPDCVQTDQLRTVYYCPIETCAYLYDSMESLRQHILKMHDIMITQCGDIDDDDDGDGDNELLEKDSSSDAIMDYVLCTTPSSSSSSFIATAAGEPVIMVMANDTRTNSSVSSTSPTTDGQDDCPSESAPSFNNVDLSKSMRPSRINERRKEARDVPVTNKNKDKGSARTNLTFSDVLRLKMNGTIATSPNTSTSNTLGVSDLCESLLLTEELPSMYYQDDAAGAEYQVLLLDSGPLGSAGNLRGLE